MKKMARKLWFVLLMVVIVSGMLLIIPGSLYASGATYDATGGSNWNSYVGYGSFITGTFNITAPAAGSAVMTIHAWDIDEEQGEVDNVYFIDGGGTEHFLGKLSGVNETWTTTSFGLDIAWVNAGPNCSLRVEPDVVTQHDWLVTVDNAQIATDSGAAQDAAITDLTLDNYDNSGANVSLNSTVFLLISGGGTYKLETNLIDPNGNNLGTFFYDVTAADTSRQSNFTYPKSTPSGIFTINAFLFNSGGALQSVRSITFQHNQGEGIVDPNRVVPAGTFNLWATTEGPGSITNPGLFVISPGQSLAYTMTPDDGASIVDVLVNGVSVGAVSSYTIVGVNADQSIKAIFAGGGGEITVAAITETTAAQAPAIEVLPFTGNNMYIYLAGFAMIALGAAVGSFFISKNLKKR
jgi:hypothetical protein